MIEEKYKIIEQTDEPENEFDLLPVGTVFIKRPFVNHDGSRTSDAWIPESITDGQDIDWDVILSDREILHMVDSGVMERIK